MNSIKCMNCGLSNFADSVECRRCRAPLTNGAAGRKQRDGKRPGRFSLASLVIYALIAAGGYFLYTSLQRSVAYVDKNEASRVGTQPQQKEPQPGLTRNEADRRHAGEVGGAIKDNPSIRAQTEHNQETQEIIKEVSR